VSSLPCRPRHCWRSSPLCPSRSAPAPGPLCVAGHRLALLAATPAGASHRAGRSALSSTLHQLPASLSLRYVNRLSPRCVRRSPARRAGRRARRPDVRTRCTGHAGRNRWPGSLRRLAQPGRRARAAGGDTAWSWLVIRPDASLGVAGASSYRGLRARPTAPPHVGLGGRHGGGVQRATSRRPFAARESDCPSVRASARPSCRPRCGPASTELASGGSATAIGSPATPVAARAAGRARHHAGGLPPRRTAHRPRWPRGEHPLPTLLAAGVPVTLGHRRPRHFPNTDLEHRLPALPQLFGLEPGGTGRHRTDLRARAPSAPPTSHPHHRRDRQSGAPLTHGASLSACGYRAATRPVSWPRDLPVVQFGTNSPCTYRDSSLLAVPGCDHGPAGCSWVSTLSKPSEQVRQDPGSEPHGHSTCQYLVLLVQAPGRRGVRSDPPSASGQAMFGGGLRPPVGRFGSRLVHGRFYLCGARVLALISTIDVRSRRGPRWSQARRRLCYPRRVYDHAVCRRRIRDNARRRLDEEFNAAMSAKSVTPRTPTWPPRVPSDSPTHA